VEELAEWHPKKPQNNDHFMDYDELTMADAIKEFVAYRE
jgi:hypothetical protein